ncbi:MAG: glycosyltransferase family 2 protein [Bacillota bacterium]|nr:glycosyltransferase family 2 protein [Bacillota bacterium]
MEKRIVIGLPAYNEEAALPKLFEKLKVLRKKMGSRMDVLVVNDGSTDRTGEILKANSGKYEYVHYINNSKNMGLGEAVKILINTAIDKYSDNDILVTLDADNTHDPFIISDMCLKLYRESLDLVVASRFTPGSMENGVPLIRKLFSRGALIFFKTFFPIANITDYSSGFRAYNIGYLRKAAEIYRNRLITTNGFDCMAELLAKFCKIGIRAGEFPLILQYDLKEGKSKMNIPKTIKGYFMLLAKVQMPLASKDSVESLYK